MLRDGAARGLETSPFVSIMEAGNRHQFTLVEPGQRCIDHVFHGHDDRRRQFLPWEAGDLPEVGRGRARQHRLDADTFVGELVLQRMAERKDIGFARAVYTVERLGRDAHHRSDVDDRPCAARDKCRSCCIGQARKRSNVESDYFVHLVNVGIQQWRNGGRAGIVDEHGDARIVPQRSLDLGELRPVAKVGGQYLSGPSRLARQTCRKGLQPRLIPGHQDEVVATLCEPIGMAPMPDDAPVIRATPFLDEFDIGMLLYLNGQLSSAPLSM